MAVGPIRGVRFIHRALIAEASRVERLTGDDKASTDELVKAVEFLAEVVRVHTESEELSIFPELAKRVEFVIPAYVFDHQEEETLFKAMRQTVSGLAGLDEAGQKKARRALHRDAIAVYEHIRLHAGKEEELLVPLLEQHFSHAEQARQVETMMATFKPELLDRVFPWIIERLGVDDRVAYLTMLKGSLPPPAYSGAWQSIISRVSAGIAASIAALAP